MLDQEEDTAAALRMVIPIIPLLQPPEGTIAAASLGIPSGKDVLTVPAQADTHGTDQNVCHSPRPVIQAIQEEAIIILPVHTSTVALQVITGMAANV
jgi:hypothetical protein